MSWFDLSYFFTGQNETARGQALDAQLATMNNADYAPGGRLYGLIASDRGAVAADAAFAETQAHLAAQEADTASYNSQVASAAADGAVSGLKSVADLVKNPFLGIPVAWWIIGGVGLFLYAGGASWLRGAFKKK